MKVWWCEDHRMPKVGRIDGEMICREVLNYRKPNDPPCRIVEKQLVPADARMVNGEDVETIAETICRIDNTTGADVAVEGVPCDLHRSVARAVLADLGVYLSKAEPPKDPWDYEP